MAAPSTGPSDNASAVPPSVRAQILATEHWSLLASRSTTQAEVLTRISIFLTLVSAGLVSLALVGQATKFSETFVVFAIAVLSTIFLIGVLTQLRVFNVGMEDLMYVLAMNRLRGAYVELDPGIAPFLMASTHDDRAGTVQTYFFLGRRHDLSQVFGSSMVLISLVNAALLGLLLAATAGALLAPVPVLIVVGTVSGLTYAAITFGLGQRNYLRIWASNEARFPSAPPGS